MQPALTAAELLRIARSSLLMPGWLAVPRDWIASFGDIVKFTGRMFGEVFRCACSASSARRCARRAS